MAEHPNVARIRDGYAAFARGDFAALNDVFDEAIVWHFAGRSQLSGDYRGRDAVYAMFGKLGELSGGTARRDVHAIFADDEHGVALVNSSVSRGGRTVESRDVDVFHLRDGKVVEYWSATHDPYAVDDLLR